MTPTLYLKSLTTRIRHALTPSHTVICVCGAQDPLTEPCADGLPHFDLIEMQKTRRHSRTVNHDT